MPKIKNMGSATMKFNEGVIVSGSSPQIYVSGAIQSEILFLDTIQPVIQFKEDGSDRAEILINDSDNLLFTNQSTNKFIVFKTNDQGNIREGFRIGGPVPEVVVNEGSDSLIDFRVESDNQTHMLFVDGGNDRVGINTDQPDYTLDVAGDMGVNQYIYHNGDGNTWINFTENRIRLNAGGNNFIDCEDPGSAPHKVRINNGGNNIDFVIKDNSGNVYFTADASTSRIGIGTETPSTKLHLASTSTDDLLFLETTEDSSSASPVIKLKRNSSSPATADYLGQLKFQGENDAGQNVTYAKITGKIGSVTDGSEQGIIEFANMKNGSSGITARLRHDSLQLVNSTNLTVDGSVGIGNTSPGDALDVTGNVRVSNYLRLNCQNTVDPTGSPPLLNHAHIYSKLTGGTAEVFVQDSDGNVTQISPHNPEGEWHYFSRNTRTGKVVRVNMEKMIRKLEEITGESFMEEWYEDPADT